jgi:hypothetical protein
MGEAVHGASIEARMVSILLQGPRKVQNKPASGARAKRRCDYEQRTNGTVVVSLFGGFALTGPDAPVALRSKKLAAMLAYLAATHPAPHSREKLMTLLWGDRDEPKRAGACGKRFPACGRHITD